MRVDLCPLEKGALRVQVRLDKPANLQALHKVRAVLQYAFGLRLPRTPRILSGLLLLLFPLQLVRLMQKFPQCVARFEFSLLFIVVLLCPALPGVFFFDRSDRWP